MVLGISFKIRVAILAVFSSAFFLDFAFDLANNSSFNSILVIYLTFGSTPISSWVKNFISFFSLCPHYIKAEVGPETSRIPISPMLQSSPASLIRRTSYPGTTRPVVPG